MSSVQPVISRNSVDPQALNIIWGVGGHHSPALDSILQYCNHKNTIIFNMEQLGSISPLVNDQYLEFLTHFRVLDYSFHNIKELRKRFPFIDAEEFPILPSSEFSYDFTRTQPIEQYDYAFFGLINERRANILEQLLSSNVKVKIITNKYGQDLATELLGCKAVLNIHAYDSSIFETSRMLRPIAMGFPVLSEKSLLPQLIDWEKAPIIFSNYNDLVNDAIRFSRDSSSELNDLQFIKADFCNNYYKNPSLLNSIRHLIGIE
jgi:hypothetical protein